MIDCSLPGYLRPVLWIIYFIKADVSEQHSLYRGITLRGER